MKKQIVKAEMWLAGLVPTAMAATAAADPVAPETTLKDMCSVICMIKKIAGWFYGILMVLGVVYVLYAAFLYLISQGDKERIENAKKALIYAIIALVIAVLAGGISAVVEDLGGVTGGAAGGGSCLPCTT
jgi:uncharacterized membrane protein